jgi:hypothetical protein
MYINKEILCKITLSSEISKFLNECLLCAIRFPFVNAYAHIFILEELVRIFADIGLLPVGILDQSLNSYSQSLRKFTTDVIRFGSRFSRQ